MSGLYREAGRKGAPYAVRSARNASSVEEALTADGRCNWLTGYGDGRELEWCGRPCRGVLCFTHRDMFSMGGESR